MPSRRRFLQSAALLGASSPNSWIEPFEKPVFSGKIQVKILATNWGFEGNWDSFCQKAKTAGYDGVEVWISRDEKERGTLLEALAKYGLEIGFLAGGWTKVFTDHLTAYESAVRLAAEQKPLYVNTHAGRDYFTLDQNVQIIKTGIEISRSTGIPVYCETHRGRAAFSAPATRELMQRLPELRLTADLSHWCVVHESLLDGFDDILEMALQRSGHIHARIGHAQGPQVNDPRAPEWIDPVKKHLEWWDKIVAYRVAAGATHHTFLTEFGPPNYLPALPYTRQPVAHQWDINTYMMQLLRERYR
jgi:sugar phosphate isomerase/epimerase